MSKRAPKVIKLLKDVNVCAVCGGTEWIPWLHYNHLGGDGWIYICAGCKRSRIIVENNTIPYDKVKPVE